MRAKYEFIDDVDTTEAQRFPVVKMCGWLSVSPSGFYDWRSRPASATRQRRDHLAALVRWVFDRSRRTYGYRRVHAELVRRGEQVSPELVRALMRAQDLNACQPRAWRTTTRQDPDAAAPVDHLQRNFTAEEPGSTLVGDITYLPTWAGFSYLATVIDCHSKMVIGWAIADHMRTSLVTDALDMAARNVTLQPGCVFHSDRGSQYTSSELAAHLDKLKLTGSMGATGVCWDNAMAESFFATLKNELVHRTVFPTRAHARRAVAEYIEVFYNRQRLHSGLDYQTPHEVLTAAQQRRSAA